MKKGDCQPWPEGNNLKGMQLIVHIRLYARVIRMRTQEIIMRVGVASGSVSRFTPVSDSRRVHQRQDERTTASIIGIINPQRQAGLFVRKLCLNYHRYDQP